MKKGRNFFLFYLSSSLPSSHRFNRIKEEVEKRGIELKGINVFKDYLLTERGLIGAKDDKIINFSKKDLFLVLSNSPEIHYVISMLKFLGLNVFPSPEGTLFSDKFYSNYFFNKIGVSTPRSVVLVDKRNLIKQVFILGGFPCVIKKVMGTEGNRVGIINSKKEVFDFIKETTISSINSKKAKFLISKTVFVLQEYIAEAKGSDYRVICFQDKVIGGIRRTSQTDDFRSNVSLGGKAEKFDVPEELEKICLKIMKEARLFYAGLDFIYSEKRGWLAIEINTSAQFEGFERATGINVAGRIVDELIIKSQK